MSRTIKLVDCTLRDGGYVNDWRFGNGPITCIFNRLNESGVDIIEIGFLDDRQPFDINRTIQPNSESLDTVFKNTIKKKSKVVAMIDYGTCKIDNIKPMKKTSIDGIRVIFKKEKIDGAISFGKKIMEKGYKLYLQMVSITDYTDEDVVNFSKKVNQIKPECVSIVDTYGLMHKEMAMHYYDLLDENLDPGIVIGYHSHNNMQLAYSNTIEFINHSKDRDIIIDGTLYGMGKNAGNAPLELLANYLNTNYRKKYNIDQMMEAIVNDILDIQKKSVWGYNVVFYLSSKNECHPNYVKLLVGKNTLSIKSVDDILREIDTEHKLRYDKKYIDKLYKNYILRTIDDDHVKEELHNIIDGKDILLIGPGRSSRDEAKTIEDYRKKNEPLTIAINFIPTNIKIDYLFLNNTKRYSLMAPYINNSEIRVIATSNITSVGKPFDYIIDYEKIMTDRNELFDNALSLFLNLLESMNERSLTLAGFDGFSKEMTNNFVDVSYERSDPYEYFEKINVLLKEKIRYYSGIVPVKFITKSKYW